MFVFEKKMLRRFNIPWVLHPMRVCRQGQFGNVKKEVDTDKEDEADESTRVLYGSFLFS